jgi:hypothetical protein
MKSPAVVPGTVSAAAKRKTASHAAGMMRWLAIPRTRKVAAAPAANTAARLLTPNSAAKNGHKALEIQGQPVALAHVPATVLKSRMFPLGITSYVMYVVKVRKSGRLQSRRLAGDDFSALGKNWRRSSNHPLVIKSRGRAESGCAGNIRF